MCYKKENRIAFSFIFVVKLRRETLERTYLGPIGH